MTLEIDFKNFTVTTKGSYTLSEFNKKIREIFPDDYDKIVVNKLNSNSESTIKKPDPYYPYGKNQALTGIGTLIKY